jgi:hypothetical protein
MLVYPPPNITALRTPKRRHSSAPPKKACGNKRSEMDWQPLELKMPASAAYDADKPILYLRLRSSDVYRYFEFPTAEYQGIP